MSTERTAVLEWTYSTPCSACGKPIRIDRDPSGGKKPYGAIAPSVRAKCKACGHEQEYPASAINNTLS